MSRLDSANSYRPKWKHARTLKYANEYITSDLLWAYRKMTAGNGVITVPAIIYDCLKIKRRLVELRNANKILSANEIDHT